MFAYCTGIQNSYWSFFKVISNLIVLKNKYQLQTFFKWNFPESINLNDNTQEH